MVNHANGNENKKLYVRSTEIKNGIGVKQRLLLHRCYLKGWIDTGDVGIYYPVLDGRKRIAELQKLAVRGLITPCGTKWCLTEKGRHVLGIGV